MTSDRARAILGADCCHPDREPGDAPGPTHLVLQDQPGNLTRDDGSTMPVGQHLRQHRRVCDGRTMIAPVLADTEIPTCDRCRRAAAAAERVIAREVDPEARFAAANLTSRTEAQRRHP